MNIIFNFNIVKEMVVLADAIDPRFPVLLIMFQCQLFFIYLAFVFSTTWPCGRVRHEVRNKSDAQVTSRDLMGEIHQY